MQAPIEEIKKAILTKYENEAFEKDNDGWIQRGGNERVPESKASHYFIDRKVNQALQLCNAELSPELNALEIGCSFGHMTSLLARRFSKLTAVDLSPESVKIAEKRLLHYGIKNVTFIADDAEVLSSLPDNAYDLVFSFSTIRFCPRPSEALRAIRAKMKPGATAVIDFPNKYSPWHLIVKKMSGIKKHVYDNLYSKQEVEALFRDAGFEITAVKRFLFTTKRLPSSVLPLAKAAETILDHIPFVSVFAGIIMIKAVKK